MLGTLGWIPDGRAGTLATLARMRALSLDGARSPRVRQIAVFLTSQIPQRDFSSEISSLRDFVFDRIRYVRDIRGVETLHTADAVLENAAGDCDDKSILLAALLESIGFKTRFSVYAFTDRNSFAHVLPEVFHDGKWIPLETTVAEKPIGWEPPDYLEKLSFPENKGVNTMRLGWIDNSPQVQYRNNPLTGQLERRFIRETDNLGGFLTTAWESVTASVKESFNNVLTKGKPAPAPAPVPVNVTVAAPAPAPVAANRMPLYLGIGAAAGLALLLITGSRRGRK